MDKEGDTSYKNTIGSPGDLKKLEYKEWVHNTQWVGKYITSGNKYYFLLINLHLRNYLNNSCKATNYTHMNHYRAKI